MNINTESKKLNSLSRILNYKISIQEIASLFIMVSFITLLKTQNTQIIDLQNLIAVQNVQISELRSLVESVIESQEAQLEKIIESSKIPTVTDSVNPEVLLLNNGMTQFYIKLGCGLVAGILCLTLVGKTFGFLSVKTWIPSTVVTWLQDRTPLFREIQSYHYIDIPNDIIWSVKVINHKKVDLLAKYQNGVDYMSASDFVGSLLKNAGTIVPYLDNKPQSLISMSHTLVDASSVANKLTSLIMTEGSKYAT